MSQLRVLVVDGGLVGDTTPTVDDLIAYARENGLVEDLLRRVSDTPRYCTCPHGMRRLQFVSGFDFPWPEVHCRVCGCTGLVPPTPYPAPWDAIGWRKLT